MQKLIDSHKLQDQQSLGLQINHRQIVLLRHKRKAYAYENVCPHLNISLEFQPNVFFDQSGEYIQCSNHGALFDIASGLCIWGPCSGQSLHRINVKEYDGAIWLHD